MFRKLLIVGALVLTGCATTQPTNDFQEQDVVVSAPAPKVTTVLNYSRLCSDVYLRKDERAKVELESQGVDWDTLACREEALQELLNDRIE